MDNLEEQLKAALKDRELKAQVYRTTSVKDGAYLAFNAWIEADQLVVSLRNRINQSIDDALNRKIS